MIGWQCRNGIERLKEEVENLVVEKQSYLASGDNAGIDATDKKIDDRYVGDGERCDPRRPLRICS